MAVRCMKCDHEMSTSEEVFASLVKAVATLAGAAKRGSQGIMAPWLNNGQYQTKCPKCGSTGRWKDF